MVILKKKEVKREAAGDNILSGLLALTCALHVPRMGHLLEWTMSHDPLQINNLPFCPSWGLAGSLGANPSCFKRKSLSHI